MYRVRQEDLPFAGISHVFVGADQGDAGDEENRPRRARAGGGRIVIRRPVAVALTLLASLAVATVARPENVPATDRRVAVTVDDLPANPAGSLATDPATQAAMTRKLLAALSAHRIPAVGFVNEGKLDVEGESAAEREARIAVLRQWTEAGFELGNHTYSHRSLNREPLEWFEADVVRGEPVTRALLAEQGLELRWFRHPFLQVGLELEKRRAFERFLEERGYRIAPVTLDNDEWIFAALYADAVRAGDTDSANEIANAYLDYMVRVFESYEAISRRLLDREPAQVLLLHANQLNADRFGELADRIAARGYRFVTLEEALRDPAYALPDDYVGAWGLSWLHHWEVTRGLERSEIPRAPDRIREAWEARPR